MLVQADGTFDRLFGRLGEPALVQAADVGSVCQDTIDSPV